MKGVGGGGRGEGGGKEVEGAKRRQMRAYNVATCTFH